MTKFKIIILSLFLMPLFTLGQSTDESRNYSSFTLKHDALVYSYIENWKENVTTYANSNFQMLFETVDISSGEVVLICTVNSDGSLKSIRVFKGTGSSLEMALINMVKKAAPFKPFTSDMNLKMDTLQFAYEFVYVE